MAKQEIFVIGIGGTGMRCIESFIHLCSVGMFDETEVNLLAIDTDKDNGNFLRLKELKDKYQSIKGKTTKGHTAHKDTFFSAKLNYYQFSPDYSTDSTFNDLYNYDDVKDKNPEHAHIADLVLTENTRTFDLKHGYRAQTHLGSMLMYHSILNEVQNSRRSDIREFVTRLLEKADSGNPRVFIFGSVFGGTGASSISIIPKALINAAANIGNAQNIEDKVYFSSILLTGYFSFQLPADDEKAKQKIIATSDKFSFNSQAAMMFYEADDTIRKIYQKLYLLGTKDLSWKTKQKESNVVTGGEKQRNDAHYVELMAAFAAHDFFNLPESELEEKKKQFKVDYLYRTKEEGGKFDFIDFSNKEFEDEFAKKMGLFVVFASLVGLTNFDLLEQAHNGGFDTKVVSFGYNDIERETINAMKEYLKLFGIGDGKGNELNGWLQQLYHSSGGGNLFLFSSELFGNKDLSKFKFNKQLYKEDGNWAKHNYKTSLVSNFFDSFRSEFLKTKQVEMSESSEKFVKHCFDTLSSLYQFN
jgi:hypothetical protein